MEKLILQPTAEEMYKLFDMAKKDPNKKVIVTMKYELVDQPELVNTKEAQKILGVASNKFATLIKNGIVVVAQKINNRNHFRRSELIQLISQGLI